MHHVGPEGLEPQFCGCPPCITAKAIEPARVQGDVLIVGGQAFPKEFAEPRKRLLERAELKHPDGGVIELDPVRGARSEAWGRPSALRPLVELDLTHVTQREEGAYGRFRDTYQRAWKGFIDPIGVRIRRGEKGIDLEAVMMPLIQSSDYNTLERMVGRARLKEAPLSTGLRMSLGVAADSELRATLDQLGRRFTSSRDIGIGWLGDWVMVGFADRSGLWDAALTAGDIPSQGGRRAVADREQRKRVWDRFPVYVGAHVSNRLALAATLTALKAFAHSVAPGVLEWGEGSPYRKVPVVDVRERIDAPEGGGGISLHYAIPKSVLVISLDRGALEQQIDAVLEGQVPQKAKGEDPTAAQSVLALKPGGAQSWLSRTVLGLLERGTLAGNRSAYRAYEALAQGLRGELPADPAAREALAIAYLGYAPAAANGGRFDLVDGEVKHSLYGTETEPVFPKIPVVDSPVTAFVQSLEELRLTLSFEGEGRHRGLRSTVRWQRRDEGAAAAR